MTRNQIAHVCSMFMALISIGAQRVDPSIASGSELELTSLLAHHEDVSSKRERGLLEATNVLCIR